MPKKVAPSSDFGRRLTEARQSLGLTQVQLAEKIGSTQRALSRYETVAEFPPTAVLLQLSRTLKISTDELLGLKPPKKSTALAAPPMDSETKRLWKKFQQLNELPEKDRRAVIRLINSLISTKQASKAG